MADPRLKGQEIELQFIKDGSVQEAIQNIGSFNWTEKLEKKEDGFLGETTNRYDDIYNGCDLDFEMQISNGLWVDVQAAIIARARRESPATEFNLVVSQFYANGDTVVLTFKDLRFGAQPQSTGSRADFVKIKIDASCSEVIKSVDTI